MERSHPAAAAERKRGGETTRAEGYKDATLTFQELSLNRFIEYCDNTKAPLIVWDVLVEPLSHAIHFNGRCLEI